MAYQWQSYDEQQRAADQPQRDRERAAHEQQVAAARASIPGWRQQLAAVEQALGRARTELDAARTAADAAGRELVAACFRNQRGQATRDSFGQLIIGADHPAVAIPKDRWDDTLAAVEKARVRVARFEAQRAEATDAINRALSVG